MRHALALTAALATPAFALAAPALANQSRLELVNRSSQTVAQLVVFHVRADGSIIDDVIGGLYDPVAPGRSAELVLPVPCGPISAYVRLANDAELSARLDTCKDPQLVVRD
jgi:hypothetical protein